MMNPWAKKIIEAGHRTLAVRTHPDVGGSDAEMAQLNAARDELVESLGDGQLKSVALPHVKLQIEMAHVTALMQGRTIWWDSPEGGRIEIEFRPVETLLEILGETVSEMVSKLMKKRGR
ncbi:MAG TPA: hypothetical protein VGR84_19125 [Candidatus Acidoferrales bacterium]|nr:hypothetical protein [Candidatus Acidoferrales bacterium]